MDSCSSVATATGADGTRLTGEIGKLLGAKWKELDDEEKKVRLALLLHAAHVSRVGEASWGS